LGRISGTEDGLTIPDFEARFTDPDKAVSFVAQTGVDALAVCIGNVHGRYHREPKLDFERLTVINNIVDVPLVLHGASGLPAEMVQEAISLGIVKLNVNTEIRQAFLGSMRARFGQDPPPDLVELLEGAVVSMTQVIAAKLRLFGSINKA
jgi:tagatose 1,6-diphosphate aldolase GatY/KbaY